MRIYTKAIFLFVRFVDCCRNEMKETYYQDGCTKQNGQICHPTSRPQLASIQLTD